MKIDTRNKNTVIIENFDAVTEQSLADAVLAARGIEGVYNIEVHVPAGELSDVTRKTLEGNGFIQAGIETKGTPIQGTFVKFRKTLVRSGDGVLPLAAPSMPNYSATSAQENDALQASLASVREYRDSIARKYEAA